MTGGHGPLAVLLLLPRVVNGPGPLGWTTEPPARRQAPLHHGPPLRVGVPAVPGTWVLGVVPRDGLVVVGRVPLHVSQATRVVVGDGPRHTSGARVGVTVLVPPLP